MRFLIDSNVFVQGKNLHYRFGFCQGFWDWMAAAHSSNLVYSIGKVKKELLDGPPNCPARRWAQARPASFFLADDTDASVMAEYGKLITWAAASTHYKPGAIAKFSLVDKADAFLLAVAKRYGDVVVTQEKPNPDKKVEIPIPDAGDANGVKTITIYDLLDAHSTSTFKFKP